MGSVGVSFWALAGFHRNWFTPKPTLPNRRRPLCIGDVWRNNWFSTLCLALAPRPHRSGPLENSERDRLTWGNHSIQRVCAKPRHCARVRNDKRWALQVPYSTPSCLPHRFLLGPSLCPVICNNSPHFALQLLALLCVSTTKSNSLSILILLCFFPPSPPSSMHGTKYYSGWQIAWVRWQCLSSGRASWRRGCLDWIWSANRSAGRDGRNSVGDSVEMDYSLGNQELFWVRENTIRAWLFSRTKNGGDDKEDEVWEKGHGFSNGKNTKTWFCSLRS